jgi:hypothetical protein
VATEIWTFTLKLEVHDRAALYDRARSHAEDNGMSEHEIAEFLGTREAPNMNGCLVELHDPWGHPLEDGYQVLDSFARAEQEA